jgi:tetratricopeptide (TPR) repeat protein
LEALKRSFQLAPGNFEGFAEFEQAAREEMASPDNANRELIFYYADYGARPEEALRLAQREMARRQDVFTRDAYAWALFQCGRQEEARREIEAALAIGVRDPKILRHADRIRARQEAAGIR